MGSVYLRGETYWIKYYRDGEPQRESSKSSDKQDAINFLKQRLGETVTGAYLSVPAARLRMEGLFQMVVDDYLTHDKRSIADVKQRIRSHLKPELGHIRAADFNSETLLRYIRCRKSHDAQNATINRELAIIRRGFNLASKMDPPKVARIPSIAALPEDNVRSGFIEQEQYETLKAHLMRSRLALVIGYHLGNRVSEIRNLEWSMVDFDAREIRIPARLSKNKKPRTLPIYGEMETALLEARHAHPRAKYVLTDDKGKHILSFKKEWDNAARAAKLPGLLFHDLRRSAVRNMVRAGIPDVVAMQISGHKTRSVFDRYNIVSGEDIAKAGKALERAQRARKTGTGNSD